MRRLKVKTVFLLRHGKSEKGPEYKTDFIRPLAKRGKKDSLLVGEFMKHYNLIPGLIISSDAERAQKTAERAASSMKYKEALQLRNELYTVGTESYIETVINLKDNISSVMLVGHNPDLEEVVEYLSGITMVIPTSTLVRIDFDIPKWSDLTQGAGNITLVIKPKGLIPNLDT
jgi:phosphohistidine phosphatase